MNVLIVGLGSIGRKHVKALRSLGHEFKIYALRSGLNAKKEDDIVNISTLENIDLTFDFAIISNPTNLHSKFIEELALKKIPLIIEKPILDKLDNAEKLTKILKEQQLPTYVACNLRFHPCVLYLKNKMSAEKILINEVNVYCGSFLPDWRNVKDFRASYSANKNMGGGVHLDLFHELDYTTWIFGFPNKSRVMLRNVSTLNINSFDYANYIFEYKNFTASIVLNYYRREPKRVIEVVTNKDTLIIDLINNKITNGAGECIYEPRNFNIQDTYSAQLNYFIGCINKNEVPMNSFTESFKVLKICLQNER
jgi:predicted dehydrogenase